MRYYEYGYSPFAIYGIQLENAGSFHNISLAIELWSTPLGCF